MDPRFDRDTAVTAAGDGLWEGRIDRGWWIVLGPNGGYVAAIVLRAMQEAVGDPERAPRSFTLHYTRPPAEGPVRIAARPERAGRSLTTVSARVLQGEQLVALGLGAFSRTREAPAFQHARMPEVAPASELPEWGPEQRPPLPMHGRYEYRFALGSASGSGSEALCGGWIRTREPRLVDAPLLAAFADAWPPAVFALSPPERMGPVPTVDLSVHFRARTPLPGAAADDFTLAVFRTRSARDGFIEEDGELWSPDGLLLAQSRQLGILASPRSGAAG